MHAMAQTRRISTPNSSTRPEPEILPPPFRQLLQDLLRGLLPGAFLGKALGLADPVLAQPDFDGESFRMLGAVLGDNHVTRRRKLERLRHLLQCALKIRDRAIQRIFRRIERPDDAGFNKLASYVEP